MLIQPESSGMRLFTAFLCLAAAAVFSEHFPAISRDYIFKCDEDIPRCKICGGLIRPDVTLYGEGLPQDAWQNSMKLVSNADCLIIGGTSLVVNPAASLAYVFRGKNLIIINRDATAADRMAQLVFHENISTVLGKIEI